jgi:acylphosphatase
VIIKGRVQGVGFRRKAKHIAEALFLEGFVRNLPDSSVEIYVEGKKDILIQFIDEVRGAFRFHIEEIYPAAGCDIPSFNGFQIL